MSYDLIPKDKSVEEISIGAFSWPIILEETGMGYVIGYGGGRCFGTHVYRPEENGASPVSNDGYWVSSTEAKAMALVGRGYVSVSRFINKEWEKIPEHERKQQEKMLCSPNSNRLLYKTVMHEDRLKQVEQFCDFAEKSKGFKIK